MEAEKSAALALVSKLERNPISTTSSAKRARKDNEGGGGSDVLNVRKAVRYASKGKGATAMMPRGDKGKRGGAGGRGGSGGGRGRGGKSKR